MAMCSTANGWPVAVSALDAVFGGGVDRGTSTLLVGPPGSGKSTIALQYVIAATERGGHAAVFAFDESKASWWRAVRAWA